MDDFQEYHNGAKQQLNSYEQLVSELSKSKAPQRDISQIQDLSRGINLNLQNCESQLPFIQDQTSRQTAKIELDATKDAYQRLRAEFNFKKGEIDQRFLMGGNAQLPAINVQYEGNANLEQMEKQQVMQYGLNLQNDMIQRLEGAYGLTEADKQLMGQIEQEVQRQDEQIDRVIELNYDMKSQLKKANQLMRVIYRRYLTDKMIACLILIIVLVIVFLMIYGAAGLDSNDDFNTPDDKVR